MLLRAVRLPKLPLLTFSDLRTARKWRKPRRRATEMPTSHGLEDPGSPSFVRRNGCMLNISAAVAMCSQLEETECQAMIKRQVYGSLAAKVDHS